jgi:predicted dinucleotide-binding enzyme
MPVRREDEDMTTVTILGAGKMAHAIATRVLAGGNKVQVLDRDPGRSIELEGELGVGLITPGVIGDEPTGDIVVLAVPYDPAPRIVADYGAALVGKVIVDITNPVDMTTFDGLVTPADSSAAEEIAAAAPTGATVVKAFNTTFAGPLTKGQVDGRPLDVFIAGDDEGKAAVTRLIEAGGMRALDAGPLPRARYLEGLGFLHMGLQMTRGTQFDTAIALLP